jgi:hypothetical protein
MKICLLLALVGLVIGFTVPALAQQKESTPDPQLRQQLVAFAKKYDEAFNNNDAAAAAALYTEDAVIVPETGPVNGRQAIEKWYADGLQKWHDSNHLVTDSRATGQRFIFVGAMIGRFGCSPGTWPHHRPRLLRRNR